MPETCITVGLARSLVEEKHSQGFSNASRLSLAFDFDSHFAGQQQRSGSPPCLQHFSSGTQPRRHRNRRVKAYLVQSEIDRTSHVLYLNELGRQRGNQCQRQVAVRDRFPIGHFSRRAICIDMNPLMVGGRLCELVNAVLIDDYPIGKTDLLALQGLGILNGLDDMQI